MSIPKRNIYVGNRYVPKIMGTWDKLKDYEGLSIVTWEGVSYTSKKRVPAGVDILNEEFWVVTGNYHQQVENYRQELREVQGQVNDELERVEKELDEEVDSIKTNLNSELEKMDNEISNVNEDLKTKADKTTVEKLGNDLNQAESDINELKNKSEIIVSEEQPDSEFWFEVIE